MADTEQTRLTATRLLILYRIYALDGGDRGATKSEVTEGLAERTAANWWKMMEELFTGGYLFKSWPSQGPARFHITEMGRAEMYGTGPTDTVGRAHD